MSISLHWSVDLAATPNPRGTSFREKTTIPAYYGIFSLILARWALITWFPYKNAYSPFYFNQILFFAYFAKKSRHVICNLNFLVFVNFPKQVPALKKYNKFVLLA